jgi:hypothetical protein
MPFIAPAVGNQRHLAAEVEQEIPYICLLLGTTFPFIFNSGFFHEMIQ